MALPPTIVRSGGVQPFQDNPLACLRDARAQGDLVALVDDQALFSRARPCSGTVAIFGVELTRQVLTDIDTFGMPVSVADRYDFPPQLAKLNAGLFSMQGQVHRERQQLLTSLLNARVVDDYHDLLSEGCAGFLAGWSEGKQVSLLTEMRNVALHLSSRLIFGAPASEALAIGALVQNYFHQRRKFAARGGMVEASERDDLMALGMRLREALGHRLTKCRHDSSNCLLERLVHSKIAGERLSEEELIAHGNVLFMSSSEPIAVALTWTLLLLSQFRDVQTRLRQELFEQGIDARIPGTEDLKRLGYLDAVVRESLRLLPPNAIMMRLTRRPAEIAGHLLPSSCEVLLSPFVAHREATTFSDPDAFAPERWAQLKVSTFEYLPFGAGLRYCVGRQLAMDMLRIALAALVTRGQIVLSNDQELDWEVNVNLIPANEPIVELRSVADSRRCGRITGAVSQLFAQKELD